MSTTRLQEILIAFGKGKQTDIATANAAANMWQLRKLNAALANPKLNTENDADEYGKGHEFPIQSFQTSWDVNGTLEKYLGAEIGAWAVAFGLGKVVKSGTAPNFTYTCTPLIPANGDAAELPYFSFVEQIRPGAGRCVTALRSISVSRNAIRASVVAWSGRGIRTGGISPARSRRITFSATSAWSPKRARSSWSSSRLAVLSLALWHPTQYLSMIARWGATLGADAAGAGVDCGAGWPVRKSTDRDAMTMAKPSARSRLFTEPPEWPLPTAHYYRI
jgi:hypothetical protein